MLKKHLFNTLLTLGKQHNLPEHWLSERPHLFADYRLPLSNSDAHTIHTAIQTLQSVMMHPGFQPSAVSTLYHPKNTGVLFGYDFHLTPEGPKLIEINTNASGAFFIALLEEIQGKAHALADWKKTLGSMFETEWHSMRGDQPLKHIVIVDESPETQYGYPEFKLFQHLFESNNITCHIAEPQALSLKNHSLYYADQRIDLIYNRLTDFDLAAPSNKALKIAYESDHVVLTPHPYAYATFADKRHLITLSDAPFLAQIGITPTVIGQLSQWVPHTQGVDAAHSEQLWRMRKKLFFKPLSGYGGKGTYRGMGLTKHVFEGILKGAYIAQTFVPASEVHIEGHAKKIDVRAYVYQDQILGFAGRLYQGQVTNFRTPGSGFVSVCR